MTHKRLSDIVFIIQSRINSKRIPGKMLRPFADSTLFEIALDKILTSSLIPNENFYVSLYDDVLKDIAREKGINIYHRSEKSVSESSDTRVVSEWHNKLDYSYFVSINPCCPLLQVETIENFVRHYLDSPYPGAFGVRRVQNFYWDHEGKLITTYPGTLDTKCVEATFEGAHCLYAGSMGRIGQGIYLGNFEPNDPELYQIEEKETFDIDYEWQFRAAEVLYKNKDYVLND